MSSHIHMIIGTHRENLENIMRDMKKHTSTALKQAIQEHPAESRREWMLWMMTRAGKKNSQNLAFQLWQQDNHPIELYDIKILHQKLDYIHYNPVVAGYSGETRRLFIQQRTRLLRLTRHDRFYIG